MHVLTCIIHSLVVVPSSPSHRCHRRASKAVPTAAQKPAAKYRVTQRRSRRISHHPHYTDDLPVSLIKAYPELADPFEDDQEDYDDGDDTDDDDYAPSSCEEDSDV